MDLKTAWRLTEVQASWLTISVQIGFILGTLVYAFLNVADLFKTRDVFFVSALLGGALNAAFALVSRDLAAAVAFRFLTGLTLAGVYPVGMKLVAQWFREQLGWRLGIMVGALTLGTAVPYLVFALGAQFDWRRLMLLASFLALAGGALVKFGIPDGPYLRETAPFNPRAAFRVFEFSEFRRQALGYFGHMWELYAFWSLSAGFLSASLGRISGGAASHVSLIVFSIIGIGVVGCVAGGWASRFLGERMVALVSLLVSFSCCALSPVFFNFRAGVLIPVVLVWGIFVIPDSAQFSALAAQSSPAEHIGTALTIQNGIGFAITVVSIFFVAWIAQKIGWRWAFLFLAIGPLIGAVATFRLPRRWMNAAPPSTLVEVQKILKE